MKKIIVTGGAGYIGSHTVVELINNGFEPIIIDNLCNSSVNNIKGIESITNKKIKWHNINCTNMQLMNDIFDTEGPIDGVIHFAAYKSVEESVKNPEKYYENNIGSLKVLLQSMEKHNVDNIIFSSSCTVYGMPEHLPVSEKSEFKKAESPYAETKQICELMLDKNRANSISLRYFNPIGSHQSSLIGDCSNDKATNLIPIITEVAIGKRNEVIIFGNDYDTHDGTCIRDYLHVEDLARAHVNAINFLIKNGGKYAFNVGSGDGVSVMQAIKIFERSNNIKVNYSMGERRKGDISKIYADSKLIEKSIGWKTKKTLDEAMKSSWNWEKAKINR